MSTGGDPSIECGCWSRCVERKTTATTTTRRPSSIGPKDNVDGHHTDHNSNNNQLRLAASQGSSSACWRRRTGSRSDQPTDPNSVRTCISLVWVNFWTCDYVLSPGFLFHVWTLWLHLHKGYYHLFNWYHSPQSCQASGVTLSGG